MRGLWFAVLGELGYRRVAIRECILGKPFPEGTRRLAVTRLDLITAMVSQTHLSPRAILTWLIGGCGEGVDFDRHSR